MSGLKLVENDMSDQVTTQDQFEGKLAPAVAPTKSQGGQRAFFAVELARAISIDRVCRVALEV